MTDTMHTFRHYTDQMLVEALRATDATTRMTDITKDTRKQAFRFLKLIRAEQARRAEVDKDVDDFIGSLPGPQILTDILNGKR